ncbi:unnamed protein product [Leptidea sinapis]|uniref:Protein tweety homolog n=1 Tax=Leptidea sinapis TaxID=189913 RepID=A0A5E4PN44_9NEOP|nr:unnamed protein product [Leptidea sinapis]
MGAAGTSDEYVPPRLSRVLHSLPHINVTLHRVNDTFAPGSPIYLEITLMILSVLCCGAIGSGILEEAMGSRARAPLARLADALDAPVANQTALGTLLRALAALRNNASAAAAAGDNLRRPLAALNLDVFMKRLWMWEAARWAGGMAGWCCGGAVCVALLAAAARRSRRALLLLCVCSLGALVSCWAASAALSAGAVAAADACQDPARAVALLAPHHLPLDMVHYYLSCKVSRENVLTAELRNAQRAVVAVRQALAVLSRGAPHLFNDPGLQPALGALGAGTGEAERALVSLSGALECRTSRAYFALSLQLAAAIVAGFLFTAIVLVDSHAWIYINTKRPPAPEEQAPFLASSGGGSGGRTLPRPAPFPNGKPPSYSAAVQLMDLNDRERPRSRVSGTATLGRASGAGAGQASRTASLNRFDPKYASFGPRAPRPRPPAPPPALATFSPSPPPHANSHSNAHANSHMNSQTGSHPSTHDKYATVRPPRRADPQPLSAAALEYRSLQRPRRQNNANSHRRRPPVERHDQRDLYAVTEL